jgi:nucleoside-diphosphate-sugar epimerase
LKKKIFVTGGTGYVGGNFLRYATKKNIHIHAIYRNKNKIILKKKIDWINIKSKKKITNALRNSSLLIHFGAKGVYKKESFKSLIYTNSIFFYKLLKTAYKLGCKKWILIGSCFEYKGSKYPLTPNSQIEPITDYGKSKKKFFLNIKNFKKNKKDLVIIYARIFQVYGKNEPDFRFYKNLKKNIKLNKNIIINNPGYIRDFINIDKVIRKIYSIVKKIKLYKNKLIIKHIAEGKGITIENFAKKIIKNQKKKIKIILNKKRDNSVNIINSYYSNYESLI